MTSTPVRTPLQLRVDEITADAQKAAVAARIAAASVPGLTDLRDMLLAVIGSWRRSCFICGVMGWCAHREPELVERWERGATR
jgi:hypothetical protein